MDAKSYLQSYGWKEGEALQNGGLKKPILVHHKLDTKGLGNNHQEGETWWESLFDGNLKNLEVNNGKQGVQLKIDDAKVDASIRKKNSPLYRMFVKGEGLAGTVGVTEIKETEEVVIDTEKLFEKQVHSSLIGNLNEPIENKKTKTKKEKKDKKDKTRNKGETKSSKVKKDKKKEKKEKKKKKEKKEEKEDKKEKKATKDTKDKTPDAKGDKKHLSKKRRHEDEVKPSKRHNSK